MSSNESDPSASRPDAAGYHAVVVPHVGLARHAAFDGLAGLAAALAAAAADPATAQLFAFGPDGRRWMTSQDPPYLFAPDGPIYLGCPPAPPAEADPYGRTPFAMPTGPGCPPPDAGPVAGAGGNVAAADVDTWATGDLTDEFDEGV